MAYTPNAQTVEELKKRFGLSYHVNYLLEGEKRVGLSGERVLEVGGSLPGGLVIDSLGAREWWGIEDFDYWNSLPKAGGGTRPKEIPTRLLNETTSVDDLEPHGVFLGKVEQLPASMNGHFTRIFSIACFEHIHRMGLALEAMYNALEPGGLLFTMFSPIWSAFDGHHIPDMVDAYGTKWTKSGGQLPPWAHLLLTPPEMEKFLREKTDKQTASELVYHIYHNPHINRFKTEDYVRYFNQSPFEVVQLSASFQIKVPEETQKALEVRYPGYTHFANNGILAILKKS